MCIICQPEVPSLRDLFSVHSGVLILSQKKTGQSSTFISPLYCSLFLFSLLQVFLSTPPSSPLCVTENRKMPVRVAKSIDLSIDLPIAFFHQCVFLSLSQWSPSRNQTYVSFSDGMPPYWADHPSIILIDCSFMLFRSVKCHWSFIVRWIVSLQRGATFAAIPSISQSLKYSYKSFRTRLGSRCSPTLVR